MQSQLRNPGMHTTQQDSSRIVYVAGSPAEFPEDAQKALLKSRSFLTPSASVYDALAMLTARQRPVAVVVSIESVDWDEMEFFELALRTSRETSVYVAARHGHQDKLQAAIDRGARPFSSAALARDLCRPAPGAHRFTTRDLLAGTLRKTAERSATRFAMPRPPFAAAPRPEPTSPKTPPGSPSPSPTSTSDKDRSASTYHADEGPITLPRVRLVEPDAAVDEDAKLAEDLDAVLDEELFLPSEDELLAYRGEGEPDGPELRPTEGDVGNGHLNGAEPRDSRSRPEPLDDRPGSGDETEEQESDRPSPLADTDLANEQPPVPWAPSPRRPRRISPAERMRMMDTAAGEGQADRSGNGSGAAHAGGPASGSESQNDGDAEQGSESGNGSELGNGSESGSGRGHGSFPKPVAPKAGPDPLNVSLTAEEIAALIGEPAEDPVPDPSERPS